MGLLQQMEEDKAKLAEMLEGEIIADEEEEIIEESQEGENEEATEEAEQPAEESTVEASEGEEKPLEGKDYARLRRERREARKAEIEAEEAARVRAQPVVQPIEEKTVVNSDPEPNRATNYPEWLEWNTRQANQKADRVTQKLEAIEAKEQQDRLIQSAIDDFTAIEDGFKKIEPAYEQAADFYINQLSRSIQLLYPQASKAEISETIKIQVLNKAAMYHAKGLNPAEELFEEAVSLGFNPELKEEIVPKKEIKPDIEKLAQNRARNAGMNGASGTPNRRTTMSVASNMTNGEWMKLTKAEKDAILKGGR